MAAQGDRLETEVTRHGSVSTRPSIAICGGGLGGLALAGLLARDGHRPLVFEARDEAALRRQGLFLTLAPNALAALRVVGIERAVRAAGMTTCALELANQRGRRLARIDQLDAEGRPNDSVTIARGALAGLLADAARAAGADLRFGMGLVGAAESPRVVTLDFGAAGRFGFDVVVAADGLASAVRAALFPQLPKPAYTGLVGTGGFACVPDLPATDGVMRMIFGHKAFFGYQKDGDGPVHWFNSWPLAEPRLADVEDPAAFASELRRLHRNDPEPIGRILAAVPAIERAWPIYDMPPIERWHSRRVVLMGDAAHAVAPHAGQGAAMALEDAVVLAACLREAPTSPGAAFARFEALRKKRTRAVMTLARRNGSGKMATNALSRLLRDLLMPMFVAISVRAARRVASFRVDLTPLAEPVEN